jgi:hypothetical protein
MIAFKDFAPRLTAKAGLFSPNTFETLEAAVAAASRWCEKSNVIPLNVETVVLPDIYDSDQEGSKDVHVRSGEVVDWHQIVRVWYLAK